MQSLSSPQTGPLCARGFFGVNCKRASTTVRDGTRVPCAGANLISCLEQRCLGARPDIERSHNWDKRRRK